MLIEYMQLSTDMPGALKNIYVICMFIGKVKQCDALLSSVS